MESRPHLSESGCLCVCACQLKLLKPGVCVCDRIRSSLSRSKCNFVPKCAPKLPCTDYSANPQPQVCLFSNCGANMFIWCQEITKWTQDGAHKSYIWTCSFQKQRKNKKPLKRKVQNCYMTIADYQNILLNCTQAVKIYTPSLKSFLSLCRTHRHTHTGAAYTAAWFPWLAKYSQRE